MNLLVALVLLSAGAYATFLGLATIATPKAWQGRDEALWLGRFSLFFGMFFLLAAFGITPNQISGWLQDILTSGGGAGTG